MSPGIPVAVTTMSAIFVNNRSWSEGVCRWHIVTVLSPIYIQTTMNHIFICSRNNLTYQINSNKQKRCFKFYIELKLSYEDLKRHTILSD